MRGRAALYLAALAIASASVKTFSVISGTLDARFGEAGVTTTHAAPGASADYQNGLALSPDGGIVAGGESDLGEAAGGFQWRITRYTRNGLPDGAFGTDGTVFTNMSSMGGFDERLTSVAIQRDGKIVVGGWILTSQEAQDSALARYNPDGTLDPTFGDRGVVVTNVASEPDHDFINQVIIDGAGRIVVAGGCRRMFVGRYERDGSLDSSFNPDGPTPGLALISVANAGESNSEILGLVIDAGGRIVGSGYSTIYENGRFKVNSALVRFLPDGSLDRSLQPSGPHPGTVMTEVAPADNWDVAFRVAVDQRGRILTAGDAFVGVHAGLYDLALVRYLDDGTLDCSFGKGGISLTNAGVGDSDDDAQGLVLQPDGSILVGGSAAPTAFGYDSDFMVARFRADGTLDRSFGHGGIAITPTAPDKADDEIFAIVMQSGSRLVASGECDQSETGRDVCVVRYTLEGNPTVEP